MNFLAHLYLSGTNPRVMVGNFIGDFVKGRDLAGRFGADIARGIELHRGIDEFTDTHAVVSQSKDRLRAKYRHYAAVIIDMYYDHFLARNWNDYHTTSLEDFAGNAYRILKEHHDSLPDGARNMLPYMINGNWLVNYRFPEGIHRALTGMAGRTSFNSRMDEAIYDLQEHYADFEKEFRIFFPDLAKFAETFLISNDL